MSRELFDVDLENALAGEAVHEHARFLVSGLRPEHFATEAARSVVEAAQESWATHGRVSLESVALTLQRAGKLASLGGVVGLGEMLAPKAAPDADELKRLYQFRRVRDLAGSLMRAASRMDSAEVVGLCELVGHGLVDVGGGAPIRTEAEMVQLALEPFAKGHTRQQAIHPGIEPLWHAVGDLPVGSMTVVIGNTNVSKTSFVLEMLMAAADRGVGAGFVSMEDPDEITAPRVLGARAGVDPRDIMRGRIDESAWTRLERASVEAQRARRTLLYTNCTGGTDVDVCSTISRLSARGVKLVAVDYLTVIEAARRSKERRNEISYVAQRLKAHCGRAGVALVLVSQITRPSDKNPNRAPTKHDAKESGDIENAAELMLGLWREEENDYAPILARVLKSKIGGNGAQWMMQRGKADGRLRVRTAGELESWT